MRLIDADWITQKLERWRDMICDTYGQNDEYANCLAEVVMKIDDAPTIDVPERKVGEWVDEPVYRQTMDGKTWEGFTYCSECKQLHEYGHRSKFCPNCGAEMKETEE